MLSLLYVSISTLPESHASLEIESIVTKSVAKNASMEITGALIFTGTHFTQALEGEEERVDDLMASICSDSRHRQVTIVKREQISVRRFRTWSMAYSGQATYIGQPVLRLLQADSLRGQRQDVDRIYALMDHLVSR